jgi:pyruvate,water dikinase
MPDMLVSTIWASMETAGGGSEQDAAAARIREAVPEQYRAHYDELLADARKVAPLRDERGIYNEAWSNGIARRTLLEVGRRLAAARRIDAAENALDATCDELAAMLRGAGGPSARELRERTEWRKNAPISEIPPFLGPPPSPPPPMDGLPPHAAAAMAAVNAAIGEVFMPETRQSETAIVGKPVSNGVYVGPARLILHPSEFSRVTRGDVLVTTATSASFNVVLPLLGAIVTDRGGQLSHAAIVAREYGIPAVVGTLKATAVIRDGQLVRVNGATGRIDLL